LHIPGLNILGWKPFGENVAQTYNWGGPNTSTTGEDGRKPRLQYDSSDGITEENYEYQEWSKPINEIDYQAYLHDVAYLKAEKSELSSEETIKMKNEADQIMIDNLEKYTPQNLYEKVVKFFVIKILKAKVKFGMGNNVNEMYKIIASQLHKPI